MDKECKISVIQNPSHCLNKKVTVVAGARKFQDIKNYFMLFSNLPFEVSEIQSDAKRSIVAISYWGEGPDSLALAVRVKSSLESKIAEFGIEKISAEFSPSLKCPD